jgi:hypothetical protein
MLVITLVFLLGVHVLFFAAFPDIGVYATVYGWCSIMLWTVVLTVAHRAGGSSSGNSMFPGLLDILILIGVGFFISVTLPQNDGISPLEKIKNGYMPSKTVLKKGFDNLGIYVPIKVDESEKSEEKAETKSSLPIVTATTPVLKPAEGESTNKSTVIKPAFTKKKVENDANDIRGRIKPIIEEKIDEYEEDFGDGRDGIHRESVGQTSN